MTQFFLGVLAAIFIASLAYRVRSLSQSGAYAAIFVGTIIFGIGGWQWAVLLLTFFITSSALTKIFKNRKSHLDEKFSKGGQRDAGQVFGNGTLAMLFAALHFFYPNETWVWMCFAASLAAVNADTWATELGVLNPHPPRMITTFKIVEKGTSGAISLIGTLAALAGSALIGFLCLLITPLQLEIRDWRLFLLITAAGFFGAMFDSFLGATAQAIYHCPVCKKETERHPLHTCGAETVLIRGWSWLNNDLVNLACGLSAVVLVLFFIPAAN